MFLIIPILALVSVFPWYRIFRLSPMEIYTEFDWLRLLFAVPIYLGLLASPGYLYFWIGHGPTQNMKPSTKVWVAASLYAAFLASMLGLISLLAVCPVPFVIASIVSTYMMIRKYNTMKAMVRNEEGMSGPVCHGLCKAQPAPSRPAAKRYVGLNKRRYR